MDEHGSILDAVMDAIGDANANDVASAIQGLATSGIDLDQLSPAQIAELIDDHLDTHDSSASDVRFGWEGRYEPGVDRYGHKIIQSGTGPPTHAEPSQGGPVDKNDVTWGQA